MPASCAGVFLEQEDAQTYALWRPGALLPAATLPGVRFKGGVLTPCARSGMCCGRHRATAALRAACRSVTRGGRNVRRGRGRALGLGRGQLPALRAPRAHASTHGAPRGRAQAGRRRDPRSHCSFFHCRVSSRKARRALPCATRGRAAAAASPLGLRHPPMQPARRMHAAARPLHHVPRWAAVRLVCAWFRVR